MNFLTASRAIVRFGLNYLAAQSTVWKDLSERMKIVRINYLLTLRNDQNEFSDNIKNGQVLILFTSLIFAVFLCSFDNVLAHESLDILYTKKYLKKNNKSIYYSENLKILQSFLFVQFLLYTLKIQLFHILMNYPKSREII